MNIRIKDLKAHLLMIFFSLSLFTFAQTNDSSEKLLQGKWAVDSAYTLDTKGLIPIDIENIKADIYTEIEITEDSIITVNNKGKTLKGEYRIDKINDSIDLPFAPFRFSWKISENKLYIEQKIENLTEESGAISVTLIYKRK